jgi:hypothetical protein
VSVGPFGKAASTDYKYTVRSAAPPESYIGGLAVWGVSRERRGILRDVNHRLHRWDPTDATLDLRCAHCRAVVGEREITVNFGDLVFHPNCSPACAICSRPLGAGEAGWRFEGEVVSEPYGWSVRPTRFWCRECLAAAPRDPVTAHG